jgi:uncharacterized membrane protein
MKSFTLDREMKPAGWNSVDIVMFVAFLIWCAAGLTFTVEHIMPSKIAGWPISDQLKTFVKLCLVWGDPILILLAFANTHLHAARQWSAGVARRWAAIVVVLAFGIETFGTATGFPFGSYKYTDGFGPVLYLVPVTIPLAWHVVVTNALFLVRMVGPHLSRLIEALFVGVICTTYDFILEPFATTVKHYWTWAGGTVPPLNYVAWFVISAALAYLFAPTLSMRYRWDVRPLLILALTVAIFIAGQ